MNFNLKDIRRIEILNRFFNGTLSREDAAYSLEVKERQFRRLVRAYKKNGLPSVKHGNSDKVPWNKISSKKENEIAILIQQKYPDFNMTHLREKLIEEEKLPDVPSYSVLRRICHQKNLVKRPRKKGMKVRKTRIRYAQRGIFLQIDGSYHKWFGSSMACLIAIVDDATSEILYAKFCQKETTHDCMDAIKDIVQKFGIFGTLYSDRAGVYGSRKREGFCHLVASLKELGINAIMANSPEAKGRIERLFGTLQDRLVPEMRLKGITSLRDANLFLQEYIPKYNHQFAVVPQNPIDFFRPIGCHVDLNEIFCVKFSRKILKGHRFSYDGEQYLISEELEYSLVGRWIEIRQYRDQSLEFFYNRRALKVRRIIPYPKANAA